MRSAIMQLCTAAAVLLIGAAVPFATFAQGSAPAGSTSRSAASAGGSSGPLSQLPIVREQLENGLRVVMSPDRSVPTVAVAVYYDVGSRNEVKGRSGFAHLFEHMMFQGSANVGKGEHFVIITNRGGSMNGTTSKDRTNYFETLPSNELALGLWLEADRLKSLAITAENFENQRQTVMEERRQRIDNRPYAPSYLRISELIYGDYWPYAHSTIGLMEDLQNAPLSAVQEFFEQYYRPNNAVLSIAGDFDPAEAMALVRQYFGAIERGEVPAYEPGDYKPATTEVVDTVPDSNAKLPAFHLAYRVPPARTPDHYALEMLQVVLADGESSRLYQSLVKEKELCVSLSAQVNGQRGPDTFSFWCVLASGKRAADAREEIYATLKNIAQSGITERELAKARNKVNASFIFGLQSNQARALELGQFELYWGNAEALRDEPARYNAVTAADIKRVATEYFTPSNRVILDVVPTEVAGGQQ